MQLLLARSTRISLSTPPTPLPRPYLFDPSTPNANSSQGILTRRGKRQQKHFTVFLARLTPEERASYAPTLNEEHSQWRWFALADAKTRDDLHPVVTLLLGEHWAALEAQLAASA